MADEEVSERAFHELWVSFCSLLRSYFAMLQVISGEPAAEVTALDPHQFEVRSLHRVLRLELGPALARGAWSLKGWPGQEPVAGGSFELLEDGRVKWSALPEPAEMDQVAETVATMVAES